MRRTGHSTVSNSIEVRVRSGTDGYTFWATEGAQMASCVGRHNRPVTELEGISVLAAQVFGAALLPVTQLLSHRRKTVLARAPVRRYDGSLSLGGRRLGSCEHLTHGLPSTWVFWQWTVGGREAMALGFQR